MPAVQKRAFPLAGFMYANVNVFNAAERGLNATNCDVYHLPVSFKSGTCVCTCEAGITVPANASSSFSRRDDEESFETSTRACEGVFLESIKKGLPTIANPVYGYSAPAKSGAGIGVLQLSTAHNRAKCGFFVCVARLHPSMVGWARASKDAPVSVEAGTPTSFSSPPAIGVFGGDYIHHSTEAAAMLATTPTQNPQFIWLIAAVRRDMPTITAKIHHIAAETEQEARRILARDHVCFFAGRLEVAA